MGKTAVKAPAYLQLYPTLRCNYSCRFCFNRGLAEVPDMPAAGLEKIAAACRRLGVGHIDILGGEPTLHPELFKLITIIHEHGLRTTLSTNGSRPDVLFALSETFGSESVRIGISVNDGKLPEGVHEYILAHRPILKTVFTGLRDLPDAVRPYIGMPGIDFFLIFRDAADHADLENCTGFESFYNRLEAFKTKYPKAEGVYCGGFIPDTRHYPVLAGTRCPAGTTKLSVACDGSVYPCYLFFRDNAFCLGNILEDDFNEIWNHPALDFFRHYRQSPCTDSSCRFFGRCRGGCPAMAYLAYGRLDAPEPRCVSRAAKKRETGQKGENHASIHRPS